MTDGVVLQVQLAEAPRLAQVPGADQRRHPDVAPDGRLAVEREEVAVAPDAGGAGLDAAARQGPVDRGVVVIHLEGTEAVLAHVERALRNATAALATDEPSNERHE